MKKTLFTLAALMFCCFLSARERKLLSRNIQYENRNELSFSYGALATSQYMNGLSEMADYHVLLGDYSYGDDNYIGPVSLEYFRRMNRWLGLGGITVFTHNKQAIVRNH